MQYHTCGRQDFSGESFIYFDSLQVSFRTGKRQLN